jgi:hypothetical protein
MISDDRPYEDTLYVIGDNRGRYYGHVKRPTRRSTGTTGFVDRYAAIEFCDVSHPADAAKAHLEKKYDKSLTIEWRTRLWPPND